MTMTPEESRAVFGDFDPGAYEDEVKERWGDTDAYKESARRTRAYTPQDWQQIGRESDAISQAFIALMDAGIPATSPEAKAVAERHRRHISTWFYPCSPEIHAGLGAMYVADARFTKNLDRGRAGLARYLSESIAALWGEAHRIGSTRRDGR